MAHEVPIRHPKIVVSFRFYDLRHTYASRAVMAGVGLPTLAVPLGSYERSQDDALCSSRRRAQTGGVCEDRDSECD